MSCETSIKQDTTVTDRQTDRHTLTLNTGHDKLATSWFVEERTFRLVTVVHTIPFKLCISFHRHNSNFARVLIL